MESSYSIPVLGRATWRLHSTPCLIRTTEPVTNVENMTMAVTTSVVGDDCRCLRPMARQQIHIRCSRCDYCCLLHERCPGGRTPSKIFTICKLSMRLVDKSRNCATKLPLLIFFDYFVGWPGSVQANLDFYSKLVQLAEWYGIMSIS